MAPFTKYKIDFTPQYTNRYWRVELVAWLIKNGGPDTDELAIASGDVVRAEFSLALTCPQFVEIRRGRSVGQTWERLENIFEYRGSAAEAPLFRQVAHQYLDERPEMKESLRKFLDEIEDEDIYPFRPSPLTVLRKLVTDPELFHSRKRTTCTLDPLAMLNGVTRLCGCNPYVPIDEIPIKNRSLLTCNYCKHAILPKAINVDNTIVLKPIRAYNAAGASKDARRRPRLKTELVSILKTTSIDYHVVFKRAEATIASGPGDVKGPASRAGSRLSTMELDGVRTQPPPLADLATWHRRLGHIDFRDLLSGHKQFAYVGLKLSKPCKYDLPSCSICKVVKLPGLPRRPVPRVETHVLQIIHADFCGPIPGRSKDAVLFFISFTDDASGWMTIYFVNHITGALKFFKKYVAQVERQFRQKIWSLQSNDDLGNDFDGYLEAKGIERRKIPTDTYHNRALLETTNCLLLQSELDDTFYREALFTACYIRNRSSSARLDGLTPYQKWFGKPPSLRHMHEFGAPVTCRATEDPKNGEPETKEGKYLGFAKKDKAYRIWIPDYKRVVLSREVDFYDNVNPQENDTRAERRGSDAGGTVERPGTSNSDAGSTSGRQTMVVIPKRKKIPNKFWRDDSERPDHKGTLQWYHRDFNEYMRKRSYLIPASSEEDNDSDEYEEEIIREEGESDAPDKDKDNDDVGEPTVTNKPVKESQEEQTPARPSAEGARPRAIPRNAYHVHFMERVRPPPTPTSPNDSIE